MRRRLEVLLVLAVVALWGAWSVPGEPAPTSPVPTLSFEGPLRVDGVALGSRPDLGDAGMAKEPDVWALRVTRDPGTAAFLEKRQFGSYWAGLVTRSTLLRLDGQGRVKALLGATLEQDGRRLLGAGDTAQRCRQRLGALPIRREGAFAWRVPVQEGVVWLTFSGDRLETVFLQTPQDYDAAPLLAPSS